MQKGMNLQDLLEEVQRQSKAKRDYVASTENDIRVVPMPDFPNGMAVVLRKGQEGAELERLEITEHAHKQIAGRLQIPWKFYHRMLDDHRDIVIDNVNKLFEREHAPRLLRTMDNRLRAFLSNRYRRLDNDEVLTQCLPPIVEGEYETCLLSSNVTDNRMYLKVLFTDDALKQNIGEINGRQDEVRPGFIIGNSETGMGTLYARGFFYRDFCLNGCVYGKTDAFEFRRSHLGGALIEGVNFEVMSDKSKKLEDEAIMSQLTDVMAAIANPEFSQLMGDKLRSINTGATIENPVPAIQLLSKDIGLTERESDSALENLIRDQNYSQWGAVNAVTKIANESESYDRACELEEIGAKLIDLTNLQWQRIANAQPEQVAA